MSEIISKEKAWAVAEAKAQLSEILRLAREQGPQSIGTRNPCIVISEKDWETITGKTPKIGDWLLDNFKGLGELEIPSRKDKKRPVPFADL